MKLRYIALATLAAISTMAAPAKAGNTFEDHKDLWNAIKEVGVSTHLNLWAACKNGVDGAYSSSLEALIVCQDNQALGSDEVVWTENDLNTLRHEAHHLVQDCSSGNRGDNVLVPYFNDLDQFKKFINGSLTPSQVHSIWKSYEENGVSEPDRVLEVEAFAVAETVSASNIANAVRKICGSNQIVR